MSKKLMFLNTLIAISSLGYCGQFAVDTSHTPSSSAIIDNHTYNNTKNSKKEHTDENDIEEDDTDYENDNEIESKQNTKKYNKQSDTKYTVKVNNELNINKSNSKEFDNNDNINAKHEFNTSNNINKYFNDDKPSSVVNKTNKSSDNSITDGKIDEQIGQKKIKEDDDKDYLNKNIKKKGGNDMLKNNFNRQLFEDAEKLDVSDSKTIEKIKINQVNAKKLNSKFTKDIWVINRDSNIVAFEIRFKHEGKRSFYTEPGMLGLVLTTVIEGTKTRSGEQIKELFDNKSIQMEIHEDHDDIIFTVTCLNKYFDEVINLICDLCTNAIFPEDKLQKNKEILLLTLKQAKFNPETLADEKLRQITFAEPYHKNINETINKIPKYDRNYIIENCYNKIFNPENASITIVGNIETNARENSDNVLLEKDVQKSFNKLYDILSAKMKTYNKINTFDSGQQTTQLSVCTDKDGNDIKYEHVKLDNPQSIIMFALPGVARTSKNKIAIRAANYIFGSGINFTARLMNNVREQNGLVYYIFTKLLDLDLQAILTGCAATRPDNVNKVIDEIKKQVTILRDKGITEEELKNFKLNKYAKQVFTTSSTLLNFVAGLRNDNVKINEINDNINKYLKLKLKDINKVLKEVFDPDKLVFVSCGIDQNIINDIKNNKDVVLPSTVSETRVKKDENQSNDNTQQNIPVDNLNNQINVTETILANGMKVIVVPTNSKNSVFFGVGYFVGCADDTRDVRGISHFLEHMMFKRTNNIKLGEMKHYSDKYNICNNAWTVYDITFYTHQCNNAFLELNMQIEADRMRNLQFDPKEIELERGAVIEERKMRYESDPSMRYIYDAIFKSLYLYSPYSEPSIGYMDQIQSYNAEKLKEHYDKYYVPNNAFALFVGDIDINKATELCNKYFGNIEKGPEIVRNRVIDPENTGITNKMTHKSEQITTESLQLFYKIPRSKIDTLKKKITISIARKVLAGGDTSVLHKQLVDKQKIVHNISSDLDILQYDASLLSISAVLQNNINIYNVEKEINKLIEDFKNNTLTEELFKLEKQKYIDSLELMLDDPKELNKYIVIEIFHSGYSIEELKNIRNIINCITYEEVKAAANDVLDIKNQALVLYQMPAHKVNDLITNNQSKDETNNTSNKKQIKQKIVDGLSKAKNKIKEINKNAEDKIRN